MSAYNTSCKVCGRWLIAHRNQEPCRDGDLIPMEDQLRQQVADLRAEVARLTPIETNAPPTKPGWYWRVNDEIDEWEPVHVRKDLDGRLYTESRDDDGTVIINLVLHGKQWSEEPIPMPVIEKEGDNADD